MKMANDLAMLFSRQMNMDFVPPAAAPLSSPPTPDSTHPSPSSAPPAYSITQHYHHSSHLAVPATQSTLSDLQDATYATSEEMLRRHGVDPAPLYPSQLTLFTHAALEQKARLIELWRISHPNPDCAFNQGSSATGHPHNQTTQPTTSTPQNDDEMMDMETYDDAEPYVVSGYEALAQREYALSAKQTPTQSNQQDYKPSTDPVYKGHGFWQDQDQQSMADQYGAHEMRTTYFGCGVRRAHWLDDSEMM